MLTIRRNHSALGNGLTQTAAFNSALQPCRINSNSSGTALGTCTDGIPSGNVLDFNYGFNTGSSYNGNVMSWTAAGQQAFTRSFTYDSLNRIGTMQETSGSAEGCKPASSLSSPYTLTWGYDAWGNRTTQSPSAGTCSFSQAGNCNNRFTAASYDAAAQSGSTQPFNIYAFSGGAQEVANVWPSLPTRVQNRRIYFYISPGRVPFGASLPSGAVIQGQGLADSVLTALSPERKLLAVRPQC